MSTLSVRIPESMHKKMKELAYTEGVSINQFINRAVTEKISALLTVDFLKMRSKKADTEPDDIDKL